MEQKPHIETMGRMHWSGPSVESVGSIETLKVFLQHRTEQQDAASERRMQKIIASWTAHGILRGRMSMDTAKAIESRLSDEERTAIIDIIAHAKKRYDGILHLKGIRGLGESFWQIENLDLWRDPFASNVAGYDSDTIGVQYKEYVTFIPTSDEPRALIADTQGFYDALFEAYTKINAYAEKTKQNVPMKFKDTCFELLFDVDSAIIYVPNPEEGVKVREFVNEALRNHNLPIGRSIRPASGFDMQTTEEAHSHRTLLAMATAERFVALYGSPITLRKVAHYDDATLIAMLLECVEYVAHYSPEQMAKFMIKK